MHPPTAEVEAAVAAALHEDLAPDGDLSAALVPAGAVASGVLASRAGGVVAGTACVTETFRQLDPAVRLAWCVGEGDKVAAGQVLASIDGPLTAVLTGERTALNFLGHLSGIATAVARWVAVVAGRIEIWDTRKTTPGLRGLEKAAVRAGGGINHRMNLSDRIMVKDNHLTGTDIASAVAAARAMWPGRIVHVECETVEHVTEALEAAADALLLDNMDPDGLRRCVAVVDAHESSHGHRPVLEASGGITLDVLDAFAGTGVDAVSSGALTAAAPALNVGLDLVGQDGGSE